MAHQIEPTLSSLKQQSPKHSNDLVIEADSEGVIKPDPAACSALSDINERAKTENATHQEVLRGMYDSVKEERRGTIGRHTNDSRENASVSKPKVDAPPQQEMIPLPTQKSMFLSAIPSILIPPHMVTGAILELKKKPF